MAYYICFNTRGSLSHKSEDALEDKKQKYGIPELKKYPMPDAKHVRSAIKFFNYVTPKYERQLADAIIRRMREYGMSFDDFEVGEENRFSKYIPKHLEHHGILGMKWGVRRYQNEDGSLTEAGKKRYLDTNGSFDYPKTKSGNRSKFDIKIAKGYFRNLDNKAKEEYEKILSMPNGTKKERADRSKAEYEFLKSAMSDSAVNNMDSSRYGALMNAYVKKSGNVYEGTSVSDSHRKALDKMDKAYRAKREMVSTLKKEYKVNLNLPHKIWTKRLHDVYSDPRTIKAEKAYEKSIENMTAVALKDIGFKNNKRNRSLGRYIWKWD